MGFLHKLFGLDDQTATFKETKPQQNVMTPCKTEQELIERYGGYGLDKQLDLGEIIGDNDWQINIPKGEIYFGTNLIFPIQVLGTFSHSSETWLWAWANTQSGLSESLIQEALRLKKYGEENEIDLLRNSKFEASTDDLHLIGLIASGMFNSSGYYITNFGKGSMVSTIKSEKVDKIRKDNHHRILTVFPQLISQFELNHNFALKHYLTAKDYNISENGNKLIATKNEDTITAEFDEQSRLIKLNG